MDCEREFRTLQGLEDHLRDFVHKELNTLAPSGAAEATAARVEEANLYCESCEKQFGTLTAFKQHKASVRHHPLSDLKCPLSTGCDKTFTSPSALILHLESGNCTSGMDRLKLNAIIHEHDTARHITYQENAGSTVSTVADVAGLLTGLDSLSIVESSEGGVTGSTTDESDTDSETWHSTETILTPTLTAIRNTAASVTDHVVNATPDRSDAVSVVSSKSVCHIAGGVVLTPTPSEWGYITDSRGLTPASTSVNGSCVAAVTYDTVRNNWPCTDCGKTFRQQNHLLAHLNSPAHAIKLFHCPTGVLGLHGRRKPTLHFKTLSGLAQHIEAGACAGGKETLDVIVGMFEEEINAATGQQVKLLRGAT